MKSVPLSPYQETLGMIYFARMLDKIRRHAVGTLREDFQANLGQGFDGRCAGFLRVVYDDLRKRTLEGGTDEEILRWCFVHGRELTENDVFIWNAFLRKVGWNDATSATLAKRKKESGLSDRQDLQTMLEYFEIDEGRKP